MPETIEQTYTCRYCLAMYPTEEERDECCRFECEQCGSEHRYENEASECCDHRCSECGEQWDTEEGALGCCRRGGDPWYPRVPELTPYSLQIDPIPSREPRLISIEQELTGGGAAVAAMLYDAGLSDHSGIESYSYQPSTAGIAVCEDGSLPSDGGEVKYSRFLLSERSYADKLSRALGNVRWLHKDAGVVKVGSSAGIHIHAAAKDRNGKVLGPAQMAALHELFSFGEDMIYGLAAAGWSSGHRYTGNGNDYAKPIPKLSTRQKNPWHVARIMGSKYYGINFERLLETVNSCRCGSVRFGAWSECECGAFDSATCEWRVFNTSTMPETIHAWLLLVLGVTARAEYHQLNTLPNQEFSPISAMGLSRKKGRQETLDWFLKSCPFSADEKDVIRAAADRSPLIREGV